MLGGPQGREARPANCCMARMLGGCAVDYETTVVSALAESARVKAEAASSVVAPMALAASEVVRRLQSGGTLFACGNGGSMSDALHLVGEMVGRFAYDRPAIRAIALGANPSSVSAIGNDYAFADALLREADALVRPADALVAISTSGNAANVIATARLASERGAFVLGLTGRDGGALKEHCDVCVRVPCDATPRVQETHITLIHALCDIVERAMHPRC